jgi:uncharacterized protein YecE (DUF72 family)
MPRAYIGTSGWVYGGWREHLYADTPTKKWLHVASRAFDALEINGSFYTQIKPETYARWYEATPPAFRFALKGHRFVSHYKRLRDCRDSIVRLRDQVQPLKEKLAAVVWQLPSNFQCSIERLEDFMRSLEAWRDVGHALELRHESWFVPEVAAILRANNVAVCMGDAPDFPMWREVTADIVYVRLHGHTRKYASSYSERSLQAWADDARCWIAEGRDVHVYFDNDAEGHAVRNALRFQELVAGTPPREIPATAYAMPSPERKPYPSPWRSVNRSAAKRQAESARSAKRPAESARTAKRPAESSRPAKRPAESSRPAKRPAESSRPAKRPAKSSRPATRLAESSRPATRPAESARPARRVAARSAPAASGSAHAAPSRRPSARPKSRASSARRSTTRTGSRAPRPASR